MCVMVKEVIYYIFFKFHVHMYAVPYDRGALYIVFLQFIEVMKLKMQADD